MAQVSKFETGLPIMSLAGPPESSRNVIGANYTGVAISGVGTSGNVVQGNYIGTNVTGTVGMGYGDGVLIRDGATNNTVGGTIPGARNIISGNLDDGIAILGVGTSGNVVAGNFIGTDPSGIFTVWNVFGVRIAEGATNDVVGGIEANCDNVISGNRAAGVADPHMRGPRATRCWATHRHQCLRHG